MRVRYLFKIHNVVRSTCISKISHSRSQGLLLKLQSGENPLFLIGLKTFYVHASFRDGPCCAFGQKVGRTPSQPISLYPFFMAHRQFSYLMIQTV